MRPSLVFLSAASAYTCTYNVNLPTHNRCSCIVVFEYWYYFYHIHVLQNTIPNKHSRVEMIDCIGANQAQLRRETVRGFVLLRNVLYIKSP